jgi:hypothetical protein
MRLRTVQGRQLVQPLLLALLLALGTMLAGSSPEPDPYRYMVDGILFDATIPACRCWFVDCEPEPRR